MFQVRHGRASAVSVSCVWMCAPLQFTDHLKHFLQIVLVFFHFMIFARIEYSNKKEEGEAFVKSIMQEYETIPGSEGMRVLRGVVSLEGKGKYDVVLRGITENFWQEVIDATEHFRVCAVGTPGIGKTATTCVLIRLLLELHKTVVYRVFGIASDAYVFMFIPPSSDSPNVAVKVIRENEFDYADGNVNEASVYYVVDPGKTKTKTCDLNSDYHGQVIIVASPDEGHWAGSQFFKGSRYCKSGTMMFFPVWTLQELITSLPIFSKSGTPLDESCIKERFERFGGVPSYVFAKEDEYKNYIQVQDRALADLSSDAAILLAYKNRSAIKSESSDLPKDILLSYIMSPDNCQKYRTGYAEFASEYIYKFIVAKYMLQLWKQMLYNYAYFDKYLYEVYVRKLFYDNVKPPSSKEYKIREASSKGKESTSVIISLTGCIASEKVDCVVEAAAAKSMVVFHSYTTKHKFIDFIYRLDSNPVTYNCFLCTFAPNHSAKSDHIYGLVSKIMNVSINNATQPKINIYYAVPKHRFKVFVTDPVDASKRARFYCGEQIGVGSNLYLKWDEIVSISILCINR